MLKSIFIEKKNKKSVMLSQENIQSSTSNVPENKIVLAYSIFKWIT